MSGRGEPAGCHGDGLKGGLCARPAARPPRLGTARPDALRPGPAIAARPRAAGSIPARFGPARLGSELPFPAPFVPSGLRRAGCARPRAGRTGQCRGLRHRAPRAGPGSAALQAVQRDPGPRRGACCRRAGCSRQGSPRPHPTPSSQLSAPRCPRWQRIPAPLLAALPQAAGGCAVKHEGWRCPRCPSRSALGERTHPLDLPCWTGASSAPSGAGLGAPRSPWEQGSAGGRHRSRCLQNG